MSASGKCRSCGAPIKFALTANQRRMPLDIHPSGDGNVLLHEGQAIVLAGDKLTEARRTNTVLHISHFATCPKAAKHRGKK